MKSEQEPVIVINNIVRPPARQAQADHFAENVEKVAEMRARKAQIINGTKDAR
jgi:hypothetical protein